MAQDVLYKLYNANEGGFFKKKANIPTPVHNATFNGLGYNNIVYATLERDVISRYNIRLINFYYWKDLVGDTLGASSAFVRSGTDVMLYGKNSLGKLLREDENFLEELLPDSHYHGIKFFHDDFDLFYTSPHNFLYWAK